MEQKPEYGLDWYTRDSDGAVVLTDRDEIMAVAYDKNPAEVITQKDLVHRYVQTLRDGGYFGQYQARSLLTSFTSTLTVIIILSGNKCCGSSVWWGYCRGDVCKDCQWVHTG